MGDFLGLYFIFLKSWAGVGNKSAWEAERKAAVLALVG